MDIQLIVCIQQAGSDITEGPFKVPIVVCPYSTGPKILDVVETFEEQCFWEPHCISLFLGIKCIYSIDSIQVERRDVLGYTAVTIKRFPETVSINCSLTDQKWRQLIDEFIWKHIAWKSLRDAAPANFDPSVHLVWKDTWTHTYMGETQTTNKFFQSDTTWLFTNLPQNVTDKSNNPESSHEQYSIVSVPVLNIWAYITGTKKIDFQIGFRV